MRLERDARHLVFTEERRPMNHAHDAYRCPKCGEVPLLVWTGGSAPEPSHEACGCDWIAAAKVAPEGASQHVSTAREGREAVATSDARPTEHKEP